MKNPIIYVVLNGQLQMSPGKAAAQTAHAVMMMLGYRGLEFTDSHKRTVIVLEAEDAEAIKNLEEYLDGAGIWADYYIDEGVNEVSPYSVTALAVQPIAEDDEEKRSIFSALPLYQGHVDVYKWDSWGLPGDAVKVSNGQRIESRWAFHHLKRAAKYL